MKNRVQRFENIIRLREQIEDLQIQGYKLLEETDQHARLRKQSFGTIGIHILWFVLTFWWTVGICNVLYAVYAYLVNTQEIILKLHK